MLADSGADVQRWMEEARDAYRKKMSNYRQSGEVPTTSTAFPLPPRFDPTESAEAGETPESRDSVVDNDPLLDRTAEEQRPSSDLPGLVSARAERAKARAVAKENRTVAVQQVTPTPVTIAEHTRMRAERQQRRFARREEKAKDLVAESISFLCEFSVAEASGWNGVA